LSRLHRALDHALISSSPRHNEFFGLDTSYVCNTAKFSVRGSTRFQRACTSNSREKRARGGSSDEVHCVGGRLLAPCPRAPHCIHNKSAASHGAAETRGVWNGQLARRRPPKVPLRHRRQPSMRVARRLAAAVRSGQSMAAARVMAFDGWPAIAAARCSSAEPGHPHRWVFKRSPPSGPSAITEHGVAQRRSTFLSPPTALPLSTGHSRPRRP